MGVSMKPAGGSADFERDVRRPLCAMAASDSRDGVSLKSARTEAGFERRLRGGPLAQ